MRSAAADPRVLSAEHDRHQCVSAADPGALHRGARAPAQWRRRHHATDLHHAVERRHGAVRRRGRATGGHAFVRAGGRRHRRSPCRPPHGSSQPDHGRQARRAVETHVARPLGLAVSEAAEGVIRIINIKMEEAIKAISTMRGYDLRDFMLLAFGGAGPIHAGRIACDLGMAGLIVPLYPGVYSAMGLMMSDVKHDYVQSRMTPLDRITPEEIAAMFARLEARAGDDLRR